MPHTLQFVATLCAMLFAAFTLYVNAARNSARLRLNTASALAQWEPRYRRAALMQAPLALVGFFYGLGVWVLDGGAAWLIASLVIGVVMPFTFVNIVPTKWARLHAARAASSLTATGLMLYAIFLG